MLENTNFISDINSLLTGKLIVGNTETLNFYGYKEQQGLNDITKMISDIYLKQGNDIDLRIREIIERLNSFERIKMSDINGMCYSSSEILENCSYLLGALKAVSTELVLQETCILKENELLKRLSNRVQECIGSIDERISEGEKLIRTHKAEGESKDDNLYWWIQLENRLSDLEVSHTVLEQTQAQIKLLSQNNSIIIDRALEYIQQSIPAWEMQLKQCIKIAQNPKVSQIHGMKEQFMSLSDIENTNREIRASLNNTAEGRREENE